MPLQQSRDELKALRKLKADIKSKRGTHHGPVPKADTGVPGTKQAEAGAKAGSDGSATDEEEEDDAGLDNGTASEQLGCLSSPAPLSCRSPALRP